MFTDMALHMKDRAEANGLHAPTGHEQAAPVGRPVSFGPPQLAASFIYGVMSVVGTFRTSSDVRDLVAMGG
jgi:hypothetical protein